MFNEIGLSLIAFFDTGGPVLFALLILAVIIFTIVIDRYGFIYFGYRNSKLNILNQWTNRIDLENTPHKRRQLIGAMSLQLRGALPILRYLLGLAPLLGLLGTVTGMIGVFDAMGTFGTTNVRPIAAGISRATIPTMTGMIIAIAGLWFDHQLNNRINCELLKLEDEMV